MSLAQIRIRSGWPLGQLDDERLGQAGQRVVDRIADVAVVDADAVGRRRELDDLARVQRPVDRRRARPCAGDAMLGDRVGDLAEGRADRADALEIAGRDPRP